MPGRYEVSWWTDSVGHWHKILGFVRYTDEEPWTAAAACGRDISEAELGNESSLDPRRERRCRKCDVARIVAALPWSIGAQMSRRTDYLK